MLHYPADLSLVNLNFWFQPAATNQRYDYIVVNSFSVPYQKAVVLRFGFAFEGKIFS